MDLQYDVIIVGCGPAGLAAAIYSTRANLKTLILEGETPGGKLTKTYEIDNYPGVDEVSGFELAMKMMNHAQRLGATIGYDKVVSIEDVGDSKLVNTANGKQYSARGIIVATGTKEKELDLPNAKELIGKGISYCAVCDGAFYRNKDVVVIGGGNSALEEALYLTTLVNKVNIVIRRDVFRADATVVEKVKNNPKINIITKAIPHEIKTSEGKVSGLVVKNVETSQLTEIACSGIFPYIGANPATDFLKDLGVLNENGYIIVNENMETSVKGIYGAGDCVVKDLRQVVTATNDGAIAANACARYLND